MGFSVIFKIPMSHKSPKTFPLSQSVMIIALKNLIQFQYLKVQYLFCFWSFTFPLSF